MSFSLRQAIGLCATSIAYVHGHVINIHNNTLAPRYVPPIDRSMNRGLYKTPSFIDAVLPGQVIYYMNVPDILSLRDDLTETFQVSYRTTNTHGEAVMTVATIWTPKVPRNPPTVLAYQFGENALSLSCAPSIAWLFRSGSENARLLNLEGSNFIPWALAQGYYVVQADAEGPKSAWMAGRMEGQAVLDGIRAAINHHSLNHSEVQVGMYGYSGGGHSVAWAAHLAEKYAPELNITCAAYGGAFFDMMTLLTTFNNTIRAPFGLAAILGVAADYPELEKEIFHGKGQLSDEGKMVAGKFRSENYCLNPRLKSFFADSIETWFRSPILNNPVLQPILNKESLLMAVNPEVTVPKFPRFYFQAGDDHFVPLRLVRAYLKEQRAHGGKIKYKLFTTQIHVQVASSGMKPAQAFIDQHFVTKMDPDNTNEDEE